MARKIFCISTLANQSQKMTQIVQLSPEFKKVRNKILSIISVSYFRISGSITNDYILVEFSCFMISTLLQKGGVDPIEVIVPSASQPIVSSSRPGKDRATKSQSQTHDVTLESELAPCPFCGKMLSLDDKRHALTECTRLNELFDPGGNVEEGASLALTPLASWCASMSRVDSLDGTPRSTRVHPRK